MSADPKMASAHGVPGLTLLYGATIEVSFDQILSPTANAFTVAITHAIFGGKAVFVFPLQIAENIRQGLNNQAATREAQAKQAAQAASTGEQAWASRPN